MDELLSVVDENDNLLRGEKRSVVHSSTLWHRGVHVFVFNSGGELLVQLRSSIKDKFPNTCDCSLSGQVAFGEGYEVTAVRELEEELGIGDVELRPILHFRMPYGPKDYMVCKLFRCNYDGKIKLGEEVAEVGFFRMGELKRMVDENPGMFTPWFVEMLKWHFKTDNKLHIFTSYQD